MQPVRVIVAFSFTRPGRQFNWNIFFCLAVCHFPRKVRWEPDSTDFNSKSFLFVIFQDKKQQQNKQNQQQWNSNIHFSQSGTQEWVQVSGTGRSPNRARGQLHRLESRRHYTHAKGNNLTQNRKRVTAMLQTHREISTRATYFQRRNQICGKLTAMPERKKGRERSFRSFSSPVRRVELGLFRELRHTRNLYHYFLLPFEVDIRSGTIRGLHVQLYCKIEFLVFAGRIIIG